METTSIHDIHREMSAAVLSSATRTGLSSVVGKLACQNNSYLKTLQTKVVGCEKGKKDGLFEVELADTVLFPEGGGQPYDTGYLKSGDKEIRVVNVQRDGLTAVHLTDQPLEKDSPVSIQVDWKRRLDHMQQHTGQHLLSAILDKRNLETLSWNMGVKYNYIELPRKLTDEEVVEVQEEVNESIRDAIKITVEQDNDADHKAPEDYDTEKGVIRVIHIGELDSNPCCGTHLANTAEIGSLALLHSTPIRGTNSRLWFMAGDRVTSFASEANDLLRKAGAELSCAPEDVNEKVLKVNQQLKETFSKERYWKEQVAKLEAEKLKSDIQSGKIGVLYKPDCAADYLKSVEKELGRDHGGTYVLFCGKGKDGGAIVAAGERLESCVENIKQSVPNVKGGGKGKYQGKVLAWEKGSVDKLLECFSQLNL